MTEMVDVTFSASTFSASELVRHEVVRPVGGGIPIHRADFVVAMGKSQEVVEIDHTVTPAQVFP